VNARIQSLIAGMIEEVMSIQKLRESKLRTLVAGADVVA
jgi:hypothetical protein